MKKSRLIGFLLLETLNALVMIYFWDFLTIAVFSRYCIGISACCSGLFLVDPKAKAHRIVTYLVLQSLAFSAHITWYLSDDRLDLY